MHPDLIQPGSSHIDHDLVDAILRNACGPTGVVPPFTVFNHVEFSNDVAVVRVEGGRRMMVKRGRYDWSLPRFETARRAGEMLREEAAITTPRSLELPAELRESIVDAYWRIELPTLAELWPELGPPQRREAMRSLGRLIRRSHAVRLPGHGDVRAEGSQATQLSQVLAEDLGGRLRPAVAAEWPEGIPLIDFLLESIPEVTRRAPPEGVLLHGDLHLGNVLCERQAGTVRCVGYLDLECAHAGPPESDLARLSVIQTDLFQMPIEGAWRRWLHEGYAAVLDPVLLGFYTIYHLAHLGFYSASIGHDVHAASVAHTALAAVAALPEPGRTTSHRGPAAPMAPEVCCVA